jgi:indoleamine 2,3-dioxygenase
LEKAWFEHRKWSIPSIAREYLGPHPVAPSDATLEVLQKYHIDPHRGFLSKTDPVQRISLEKYFIWEDVADDLSKFLGVMLPQVRDILLQLPKLSTDDIIDEKDLYRAHFLLSLFAHAYVWGGVPALDYIPENIAVPLWEVSKRLAVPPALCYFDIVLNNWRRLDDEGVVGVTNIATLNNFFGGRDESWFYLISVEIEASGAKSIIPLYELNSRISMYLKSTAGEVCVESEEYIALVDEATECLKHVADAMSDTTESLRRMRHGCDPYVFYHRVRPFLAAWKSNPAVPNGVRYLGVTEHLDISHRVFTTPEVNSDEIAANPNAIYPFQQFSGGSAAQSSLFPFFDILLGVDHSEHDASARSNGFLHAMKNYMPVPHREFLAHLQDVAVTRKFMGDCKNAFDAASSASRVHIEKLLAMYDKCLDHLSSFRSLHINIVAEYILAQQHKGISYTNIGSHAGGKGTGGTDLMMFLKPMRDNVNRTHLHSPPEASNDEN